MGVCAYVKWCPMYEGVSMPANPFVVELFPDLRVHLIVDLLEVTQAGFPTGGGGRVQAAKEDLPRW